MCWPRALLLLLSRNRREKRRQPQRKGWLGNRRRFFVSSDYRLTDEGTLAEADALMDSPVTTSSTRRFCCRPAAVSLDATGEVSPKPLAVIEAEETPCPTRNSETEEARRSDSL